MLCAAPAAIVEARPMWGVLGHYMTAAIAQGFLTQQALNGVTNLLPETNGDMGLVASWADAVGRDAYKWSAPLHYINTPDWSCTYQRSRDCSDHGNPTVCVDGAIQNFTPQLLAGQADLSLNVALKFAIHFIGDIHQPLHVGFTSDEGGNTEKGTFEGTDDRKLHQIWDIDMVEKRINDDYQGDNTTYLQYYMNRLQSGDWAKQVESWRSCPASEHAPVKACSQAWAQDSVKYACSTAYTDDQGNKIQDGFDLEDGYYQFAIPVAELQIAKGGIRLANVVNALFAADGPLAEHAVAPELYQAFLDTQSRAAKILRTSEQKIAHQKAKHIVDAIVALQ